MTVSYSKIGKNIAAERNKANMTQEELAERMGISTSHFSNVERAKRKASIAFLVNICAVLDIPLERLLSGAIGSVALYANDAILDDEKQVIRQIVNIVEGCNSKTRKHILDMCLAMADLENPE